MCNILWLKPGQMPTDDDFENMVYNNWHGWGLVLRDGNGKLQVMKGNPEENDPEELYELIDKNRDLERFLHVRHATAGGVELENIHPFEIISTNKGQLLFMHNGTMSEYNPEYITDKTHVAVREGWSDTRYFAESVLTPVMDMMKNPLDIWAVGFVKAMGKLWPLNNRGLLITNKGARTLGVWEQREDTVGNKFLTSNTTYFNAVTRGPEFDRRESARKFAETQKRIEEENRRKEAGEDNVVPFQAGGSKFTQLRSDHFTKVFGTTRFLKELRENPQLYNADNLAALATATAAELDGLVEALGPDLVPWLMYVTEALSEAVEKNKELEDKVVRATKFIATLRRLEPSLPGSIDEANTEILLRENAERNVRVG